MTTSSPTASFQQQGEDPLITKIQVGVSHLQSVIGQVHNLSTSPSSSSASASKNGGGSIGSEINDILNAADQLRQERDATQYEMARLRQENAAVHQTLRGLLRIIERFSAVTDPVVASDGYTYERKDILKYFDDCKRTSTTARSHLTQEDLKEDLLVPNFSMKRMLTLLHEVEIPRIATDGMQQQLQQHQQQQRMNNSGNLQHHNHHHVGHLRRSSAPGGGNDSTTSPSSTPGTNNVFSLHTAGRITPQQHQQNVSFSGPPMGGNPVADSINSSFQNQNTGSNNISPNTSNTFNRDRRRSSTDLSAGKNSSRGSRRQSLQTPLQLSGKLHPCLRVYGRCKFENECVFANYPFECCLSHLKGKCRFGATCLEPHVEFNGDSQANGFLRSDSDPANQVTSGPNSRRQSVQ